MKNNYIFPAIFQFDDDVINVRFPDISGCITYGTSEEEAFNNAVEALGLCLYEYECSGDEIPKPSSLTDINVSDGEVVVLIPVNMYIVRNTMKEVYIKKTLTLPQWLNDAAVKAGINFSETLRDALKVKLGI